MFKIHYPARGRKLVSALFPALMSIGVQNPLPRKGTETAIFIGWFALNLSFKIHYPARGRKLENRSPPIASFTAVQNPLPRKGTETSNPSRPVAQRHFNRSKSITPQGDGNPSLYGRKPLERCSKSITPQGNGN